MKRFITCQLGSRHNYALPSVLADAELLETFYTDLCGNQGIGRIISQWCPSVLRRGALKNLIERQLPPNIIAKTHTFPQEVISYLVRKKLASQNIRQNTLAYQDFLQAWGEAMIAKGWGKATHCLTMFLEGLPLLQATKQNGLTTVSEIFILWSAHHIVEQEQVQFPDLETPMSLGDFAQENTEAAKRAIREFFAVLDWAIAPSEAVRQDQALHYGFPSERCFVVPYGIDSSWFQRQNVPIKGRILFVGTAGLRKGIHYLAMAANRLSDRSYEYRVAGSVSSQILHHSLMRKLTFLGRIPRTSIGQEYESADILVLPTLAEGSAEVTYEALAMGIPVITTAAAGSVVRHGIDGFIVPERDPETLAQCLEELVENRELRDRMSRAAKQQAREYTWAKYAERLLDVFQQI